ncbi:hypothetical protein AVP41_01759 [Microbacterium sp. TNHR37B]|nr:hypothetical protein AVP41_01759 [Microbacterium sp. TNHR37B]
MQPSPETPPVPPPHVSIAVERTGGIAGLVRRWTVDGTRDQDDRWAALVAACPWPDAGSATSGIAVGADRFCWSLTAMQDGDTRHVELSESELEGPWRTLVDAVRAADATRSPSSAAEE